MGCVVILSSLYFGHNFNGTFALITGIFSNIKVLFFSDKTMDLLKEENGEKIGEDDNFHPFSVSNIERVKTKRYLGTLYWKLS